MIWANPSNFARKRMLQSPYGSCGYAKPRWMCGYHGVSTMSLEMIFVWTARRRLMHWDVAGANHLGSLFCFTLKFYEVLPSKRFLGGVRYSISYGSAMFCLSIGHQRLGFNMNQASNIGDWANEQWEIALSENWFTPNMSFYNGRVMIHNQIAGQHIFRQTHMYQNVGHMNINKHVGAFQNSEPQQLKWICCKKDWIMDVTGLCPIAS